jgi:hypothetical protein
MDVIASIYQDDCNLVLYSDGKPLWASNTISGDNPLSRLINVIAKSTLEPVIIHT